jgi:hypothetical protein
LSDFLKVNRMAGVIVVRPHEVHQVLPSATKISTNKRIPSSQAGSGARRLDGT